MNLAYSVFSSSTMKHPNPGHSQNLKEVLQSVMEVFNFGSVTTNDIMQVNQHCSEKIVTRVRQEHLCFNTL